MSQQTSILDENVARALAGVLDPETGINIVDFGLVYAAAVTADGIRVRMTMTTPSCPVTELMVRDAEAALRRVFPDSPSIRVDVVWDPPWSPERMSEAARRMLGWSPQPARKARSWLGFIRGRLH